LWNLGVAQGQACTIVLRGATQQILDEAERSIHDVLCVLSQTVKEPRICYGGGLLTSTFTFQEDLN
jgi:T-complex protein 1 subunit beta